MNENTIDRTEAMTEMLAGNVKSDEEDIYIKISAVVQLLRELSSVNPTKTSWIPVSERLPENRKEVLVTDDTDIFTGWYEGDKWCSCYEEFCPYSDPIIAWMPLPKPYEPQERSGEE